MSGESDKASLKAAAQARVEKYKLIRWTIAALTLLIVMGGIYWFLTAPSRLADKMGDKVSVAASKMDTIRPVPAPQRPLDNASETAYSILETFPPKPPEGVKQRAFYAANFRGSQNRICKFALDFGAGDVAVFAAVDIKAHATEKTLGSPADRLIRIVIQTAEKDLPLRSYYDDGTGHWKLRWRRAMIGAPITDDLAGKRTLDALKAVPKKCNPKV